jgi:hypothetical protein
MFSRKIDFILVENYIMFEVNQIFLVDFIKLKKLFPEKAISEKAISTDG